MKTVTSRNCPICNFNGTKLLHLQKFFGDKEHKIVSCNNCGFVFVPNTPSQEEYNKYYKEMSCYEEERDHNFHFKYVDILKSNLNRNSKIIDIGCSTGHLLHLLKRSGFKNIYGIDPSPVCKNMAWRNFKIKIGTKNLFDLSSNKKYDCVILAAVLEHIEDLRKSIFVINSILEENGKVLISVPDAENFYRDFDEPFGEFSTEHINFFSFNYIQSLMAGYKKIYSETDGNAVYTLWEKSNLQKENIKIYIDKSNKKMFDVNKVIKNLPPKIIVWGAGSLTKRLLAETNLGSKVVVFIDRNKNLIGKSLNLKEILRPGKVSEYKEPILISSFRFKNEIKSYIKSLKIKNKIIVFK